MSDITARKQAEQELAEVDRRKDQFLAMLSHELRNPLAPILNAVQLLQLQKGANPVQQKALDIIERQVGQLTHLVDDLLDVSRAITGKIQLRQEPVAMSSILERAVETVRPSIDQRRHELAVSLPPEPIWLYADASRLEQVVTNLLTNAAKYTKEGGHIWLSARQEGDKAVLRVRDTGLGIDPGFAASRLRHLHPSRAVIRPFAGRVGSWIDPGETAGGNARGNHRGFQRFGARQRVRRDSCRLSAGRLSPKTQPPPRRNDCRMPTRNGPCGCLSWMTTWPRRRVLELLIQASGHSVRLAHTGPTALAAALDYRPDVMLLDIGLPELDGFEVARRIRQQPDLREIVLVAITGYGQDSDRQRSKEAGFDHHLVKPADFNQLRQILAAVAAKDLPDARATSRMNLAIQGTGRTGDGRKKENVCHGDGE